MYTTYFGFQEKPFTLTPNPRFIYLSKNHKEAFAHLLYGIRHHYGFIALIGEIGTGKTTVLRTLLEQLKDEKYRTALIFSPCMTGVELLRCINKEFGLDSTGKLASDLLLCLNSFLLGENAEGKTVVLVIDEAQNLKPEVLEQLRLISNLETENDKLIQIVLAGQPELGQLLGQQSLRQLNQRIAVRYRLKPMNFKETATYIQHRMEVAGKASGDFFTRLAMLAIHLYAMGVPRVTNILCDRSLLVAYGDEKRKITFFIVFDAILEIFEFRRFLKITVHRALIATAALSILFFLIPWPGQKSATGKLHDQYVEQSITDKDPLIPTTTGKSGADHSVPLIRALPLPLHGFVSGKSLDKSYSSTHPGWVRFIGYDSESRIYHQADSVKAIQLLDRSGNGLSSDMVETVEKLSGKPVFLNPETAETREGFFIQRGDLSDKLKVVYYRDIDSRNLRAIVLVWH